MSLIAFKLVRTLYMGLKSTVLRCFHQKRGSAVVFVAAAPPVKDAAALSPAVAARSEGVAAKRKGDGSSVRRLAETLHKEVAEVEAMKCEIERMRSQSTLEKSVPTVQARAK